MALFTDSDIITADDLQAKDPEIRKIASAESPPIILEGNSSIIRNTVEECGHEILSRFQNYSGYLVSPSMPINHVAAVNNIFSTAISRSRFRLNQVLGSGPDPSVQLVQRWLEYSSLTNAYRAAFARFSDKNDRFERKMDLYAEERDKAWARITWTGIPVVLIPLPCPGAIREPLAGTFDENNLSPSGSGSTDPGSSWFVAITWTGAAYQSPQNPAQNESGPSAAAAVTTASGQKITVSIANLTPPASTPPNVGTADGLYTQVQATGWNIYAGSDASKLRLQNATPIPVGTTSYTLPDQPTSTGALAAKGQFPDYNFAWSQIRFRA